MFIRTENLLLRPGWVEDAPELHDAFAREDVVMTLARAPWPYALGDAVAHLGRERSSHESDLLIYLRTSGSPRLIGGVGIAGRGSEFELGYWIVPSMWNRGYATEAGRALVAAARDSLRLDRLVSAHFIENPASGRVLRKLGFVPTGRVESRVCTARRRTLPCASYTMALTPSMALAA
ncbi:MAG: GNAT family N-acetyltransferase [Sphingomonadales bacterium]